MYRGRFVASAMDALACVRLGRIVESQIGSIWQIRKMAAGSAAARAPPAPTPQHRSVRRTPEDTLGPSFPCRSARQQSDESRRLNQLLRDSFERYEVHPNQRKGAGSK